MPISENKATNNENSLEDRLYKEFFSNIDNDEMSKNDFLHKIFTIVQEVVPEFDPQKLESEKPEETKKLGHEYNELYDCYYQIKREQKKREQSKVENLEKNTQPLFKKFFSIFKQLLVKIKSYLGKDVIQKKRTEAKEHIGEIHKQIDSHIKQGLQGVRKGETLSTPAPKTTPSRQR